jgi:hypothetical protein
MKAHSATSAAVLLAAFFAGCAQDGTLLTGSLNTSAIDQQTAAQEAAKADPACLTLASQIESLTKDGIADKVSKAAIKKYKMKTADLAKADELNRANAEFQTRCSSYPPNPTLAAASPEPPKPTPATPKKVASKSKPPVPAPKPVAAALTTQETGSLAQPPPQP